MSIHGKAKDVATYVWYERTMFDQVFQRVQSLMQGTPDQFLQNILLESFLLHTRILRDFLFREPTGDDVSAIHFFETPAEWAESATDLCPYLSRNKPRLDKALAHLSYKRIGYEPQKGWDCGAVYTEIEAAWTEFWSRLATDKRDWFTKPRNPQS